MAAVEEWEMAEIAAFEILEWVAAQEENRGGQWVKDGNGEWAKARRWKRPSSYYRDWQIVHNFQIPNSHIT